MLTVICSLRNSRSSSQLEWLCLAAASFDVSSVSASSRGYDNITFAWYYVYRQLSASKIVGDKNKLRRDVLLTISTPRRSVVSWPSRTGCR